MIIDFISKDFATSSIGVEKQQLEFSNDIIVQEEQELERPALVDRSDEHGRAGQAHVHNESPLSSHRHELVGFALGRDAETQRAQSEHLERDLRFLRTLRRPQPLDDRDRGASRTRTQQDQDQNRAHPSDEFRVHQIGHES